MRKKYFKKYWRYKYKHKTQKKHLLLVFLFISVFIFLFYLVCLFPGFQIKEIKIMGNEKIKSSEIEELINSLTEKKVLFVRSRSIFLANTSRIEENILSRFPAIERVSVKKRLPQKIEIIIKERKPIGVISKEGYYLLIDYHGVIFEKVKDKGDLLELVPSEDLENLELGEIAVPEELINAISKIEKQCRENDVEIDSIKIISPRRLNAKTEQGWEIYFNPSEDISRQLLNLKVALDEKISPKERKSLEYIDLRFGNQIFYK